jgi:phospholipid/cholesterol/gamma-HCH transport system permease protein
VSVLLILGIATGATLSIEALSTLNIIGFGSLSGIIAGIGATRELGPLVAGIAFASQAGCRMTAEIGSMRISEEIDAVDAMGLRPIPFVVGTRLIGAIVIIIPGYLITLTTAFFVMNLVTTILHNEPGGTYQHYFVSFLVPIDLFWSLVKATIFCTAVTIIHCYYG